MSENKLIIDMEVEKIKKTTINDLDLIIEDIKNIQLEDQLSYQFNTKDILDARFVERFLGKLKKDINHKKYKYIYTFYISENFPIGDIYQRYEKAKDSRKAGRAYARLNRKSHCLYVGSSKGLISRLKQHLGFGPKGTYAIQLCHWCENLDFKVSINIYAFRSSISTEAFQAFEDGVWKSLLPMFGRQGKK